MPYYVLHGVAGDGYDDDSGEGLRKTDENCVASPARARSTNHSETKLGADGGELSARRRRGESGQLLGGRGGESESESGHRCGRRSERLR